MAIKRWHAGKLIILWAWGGLTAAVLVDNFLKRSQGAIYYAEFVSLFVVLLLLSAVTWIWLGDRELKAKDATEHKEGKEEPEAEGLKAEEYTAEGIMAKALGVSGTEIEEPELEEPLGSES